MLINVDYEGGSFQLMIDDHKLKKSGLAYFVYADEIELVSRDMEIP